MEESLKSGDFPKDFEILCTLFIVGIGMIVMGIFEFFAKGYQAIKLCLQAWK